MEIARVKPKFYQYEQSKYIQKTPAFYDWGTMNQQLFRPILQWSIV